MYSVRENSNYFTLGPFSREVSLPCRFFWIPTSLKPTYSEVCPVGYLFYKESWDTKHWLDLWWINLGNHSEKRRNARLFIPSTPQMPNRSVLCLHNIVQANNVYRWPSRNCLPFSYRAFENTEKMTNLQGIKSLISYRHFSWIKLAAHGGWGWRACDFDRWEKKQIACRG